MKPLQPGHHSASIVANEIGVDSVGVEDRLRDMGFDFVGEGSDDRVELGRPRLHLDPQASCWQTESVTRQPRLPVESTLVSGTLSARFSSNEFTTGEYMKVLSRLASLCTLVLLVGLGCRKETKGKEAAGTAQDTMLLRDLAEANKNTAAAATLDNSLNTVRTASDGLSPTAEEASQSRLTDRVATRPLPPGSQALTSGTRLTVPTTASDAPGPTTVPLSRSPASSSATRSSRDPCDSPNLTDQRYCLNRSIAANDADLNQTYQDLISQARKSGGSDLEDRFQQSQREWINQRDADCTAQTQSQDGKLWARARAKCLADYSGRRTAELQKSLSGLRGQ